MLMVQYLTECFASKWSHRFVVTPEYESSLSQIEQTVFLSADLLKCFQTSDTFLPLVSSCSLMLPMLESPMSLRLLLELLLASRNAIFLINTMC